MLKRIILFFVIFYLLSISCYGPELGYNRFVLDFYSYAYKKLSPEVIQHIYNLCKKNNVDFLLILVIIKVESNFKSKAISNKGAIGLMQIHPLLATQYNVPVSDLYNPFTNIEIGIKHLSYLLNKYKSVEVALMCYLCGEAFVKRDFAKAQKLSYNYIAKIKLILGGKI